MLPDKEITEIQELLKENLGNGMVIFPYERFMDTWTGIYLTDELVQYNFKAKSWNKKILGVEYIHAKHNYPIYIFPLGNFLNWVKSK